MTTTKIYFCTDIHGSTRCWRKLVSAGEFYKVNHVILGGDMTGKAVVPIVQQPDGKYTSNFLGRKWVLKQKEVDAHKKLIVDAGMYFFDGTPQDFEQLREKKEKVDEIFKDKVIERLREWLAIAEANLRSKHRQIIVAPGNDDQEYVDPILRESEVIVDAEGEVLSLDGNHEMLSSGWTNFTPWHTVRECSEEELMKRIEDMVSQIKNMESSIFSLHVPPFESGLDTAPKLNENMEIDPREMIAAGSTAVRDVIKKHQPMLGLHGHIHEVTGKREIGRTLCINPGSNYTEGILSGVLVTLEDKKVESVVFTSG